MLTINRRLNADSRKLAERWAGEACTINGEPARITGRLEAFATVATLDPDGPAVPYSWHTVARVMSEHRGAFKAA